MSILADDAILREIKAGNIVIDPFNPAQLGSNSYDVRLGRWLAIYKGTDLDFKKEPEVIFFEIPPEGYKLKQGVIYLGVTQEYTETRNHVPCIEGKSSVGRMGISIHATAGFGDISFAGHWTLEISVVESVRIYAGMEIGQIYYNTVDGECLNPYDKKPSAKYANGKEDDPRPYPYAGWKNFLEPKGETNG